ESDENVISPANYFDWKKQNTVFESIGAFSTFPATLAYAGHVEEIQKQVFSSEVMPMLGVQPIRGRAFTAEDDKPGAPNVEIISYHMWQTWFGGDETVIGRKVQMNSRPATIIGVMPPGFYLLNREVDIWETLNLEPARDYRKTSGRYLMSVARLKP